MQRTIEAAYVNGVFRPVEPVNWLEENRRVTIVVDVPDRRPPLAGWVGGLSNEDAAAMREAVAEEFERVNPDDWK